MDEISPGCTTEVDPHQTRHGSAMRRASTALRRPARKTTEAWVSIRLAGPPRAAGTLQKIKHAILEIALRGFMAGEFMAATRRRR